MLQVGKANKGLKRQIGQWAKKTGLEHNQNVLNGTGVSMSSELKYKIADKVVFQVSNLSTYRLHTIYMHAFLL